MSKQKNKLLFITPSFTKGGAEKVILNIINQLNSELFDIHLIVCTSECSLANHLNKDISIYKLEKSNVKSALLNVFSIINKIKPEVVFTSSLHIALPVLFYKFAFFKRYIKVTRFATLPSNNLDNKNIKQRILKAINQRFIRRSSWIVAQTDEMRDEIISYYNACPNRVIHIPNIVDVDTILEKSKVKVDLPRDCFYYLAAGSLYSVKGFDLLIRAFYIHLMEYPSSILLLIGEESIEEGYRDYLESIVEELNIDENVLFLGYQENPYKYFKFSDAFVLSSIKEGFPNVVLENLVLNKPILTTNCVNFDGVISKDNGLVVNKNSIEELVFGLKQIRQVTPKAYELNNFDFNNWFAKIIYNEGIASY